MLHRFDHVVIAVRDLEDATRRYTSLLGRAPSWRGNHLDAETANTLFRLANCYLELLAPTGTDGPVAAALDRTGEGILALSFATDDADAFALEARARGLDAADPAAGEGRLDGSDAVRKWRTVMLHPKSTRGLTLFAIEHLSPDDALPVAEPTSSPENCIAALDHVVVSTRDIESTGALYRDALGLRLALDRSFEARGLRMMFFRIGGVTVEVVGSLDNPPDPSARDRFGGLAFQVPDASAAQRRLALADFDVSEVRPGHKPGTSVFSVRGGTCGVPTLVIEPTG
jgi:catechol 2,3-dioxygenase-like lactoylglutathione lyase family enzyme